jgi:mersacidin/lichenicidin family type 2 lantibiotic
MSNLNIIHAWKDEEYRLGLSEDERARLPEHPAGLIELADAALDEAAGGAVSPAVQPFLGTDPPPWFLITSLRDPVPSPW